MKDRGDDIEDDYVPDGLLAESDSGDDDAASVSAGDDDHRGATDHTEAESSTAPAETAKAKKRKRREKEKERKAKVRCVVLWTRPSYDHALSAIAQKRRTVEASGETSEPASIAAQPPALLAEYLSKLQAKSFSKLTAVELDDIRIPGKLESTHIFNFFIKSNLRPQKRRSPTPRTGLHLGRLISSPILLRRVYCSLSVYHLRCLTLPSSVVPTLKTRLAQKSKENGAPTLIFIAGGALRVADVTRVFKSKTLRGEKGGDVAKLFARHIKLEEHVTYLTRTKVGAAVGTPGRIGKLLCDTGMCGPSRCLGALP